MNYSHRALSNYGGLAALVAAALATSGAHAAPSTAAGYSLKVFAAPLAGSSAPDSIEVVGSHVFVGYGGGGAPDGSGGAMSTVAEYSASGALLGQTTVVGHNDGLRYDAATGELWAVQNEDANPNLVLINPATLGKSSALPFSATPHGGGYDDVAFGPTGTFLSASNPANNPNTAPAIVSVGLSASQVVVNGGVLTGTATATVINPPGGATTLNLQDPDSMIFAPNGQLVLDSQADHQLVFITNPGATAQSVSVLNLADEVDDTEFTSGAAAQRLLFADRDSGIIYALSGPFSAGGAVSAADVLNEIVGVNLSTGAFTPLVSGLDGPHGEALLSAVPEPSEWLLFTIGLGALGAVLRLNRKLALAGAA